MDFEIVICELIERVVFAGDTDLTQIMIALFDRRSFPLPRRRRTESVFLIVLVVLRVLPFSVRTHVIFVYDSAILTRLLHIFVRIKNKTPTIADALF